MKNRKTQTRRLTHVGVGFLAVFLALPLAACAVATTPDGQGEATAARTVPVGTPGDTPGDTSAASNLGAKGLRRKSRSVGDGAEPNPSPWTEGQGTEPNPSPWNGGSGGSGGAQDPQNHSHDATLSKDALTP